MINALTVDVEDYHNVLARDWLDIEVSPTHAVVANTNRLLELFSQYNARATFFILGEVAETYPQLIRDIAAAGHELGVHGYRHRQIFKLTPEEFRREISKAKSLVEDAAGVQAPGHRAPAFSITLATRWAFEILADAGFRFDSSVFPIAGRRYGWPGFPPDIHEITLDSGRTIIEVPMSTVSIAGRVLPACGGGYLRHFPLAITRWAIRRIQRKRPAVVYLHPYEIESTSETPDANSVSPDKARRLRRFHRLQMRNRHTVERKILGLLEEFQFAPVSDVIGDQS
ncbi:MAG: DUF3473 domain-containing protein [Planctomycetota bacterium]|jgi:polysaccharide deacetylase family protein (PEP-CTERM system associated)